MKKEEVKQVIDLREYVIRRYKDLDGGTAPGTSIIKQSKVADTYETLISMIDDILKEHVNFS